MIFFSFQMATLKEVKKREIPFILDGTTIMKRVAKTTTCSDVIGKLPNLEAPLAVFQSIDGIEQELKGKTRLLKIWRAYGSTKKVEFVIKKSQMLSKTKKTKRRFLGDRRKSNDESVTNKEGTRSEEILKQVCDLAFHDRCQRTKIHKPTMKSELYTSEFTQTIKENLRSQKLGLKQKFVDNGKVRRTTSAGTISSTAGTISSTDTGYQSIESDNFENEYSATKSSFEKTVTSLKKVDEHEFKFFDQSNQPRHSTPVLKEHTRKRRPDLVTCDKILRPENLKDLDEFQGKTMIFQKFMTDQPISSRFHGNDVVEKPDVKCRLTERYDIPDFRSKEEVCRFLWDQNCDSDSELDSDTSLPCESLDLAFNAGMAVNNRQKQRESVISNMNRFSIQPCGIGLEDSDFEYSFDCSFQKVDKSDFESFKLELSGDFDASHSEDAVDNGENEDDRMESFMKTRSFIDIPGDVTMC